MDGLECLVVGAGYTGRRILQLLGPTRATGVSRSGGNGQIRANLDDAVPPLPAARAVIYTVPPSRRIDPDPRLPNLLAALSATPEHFLYFSTSGVYGDCAGRRVDEDVHPAPTSARSQRRAAAEALLERQAAERGFLLTILRVPGIYGPGRLRLDARRAGEAVLAEADAGPGNRIHVDDLAGLAVAALSAPAGIYNVGDGDERSSTWFAKTVARLAGLPAPPEVSMAEAEKTFSETRLSFLRESRRLDLGRIRRYLNHELLYPDAEAGIRASLAEDSSPVR